MINKSARAISREQILNTATQLFIANGYANTSLDKVAHAGNTTVKHIKHYYQDMAGIAYDVLHNAIAIAKSNFVLHTSTQQYINKNGFEQVIDTLRYVLNEGKKNHAFTQAMSSTIHTLTSNYKLLLDNDTKSLADLVTANIVSSVNKGISSHNIIKDYPNGVQYARADAYSLQAAYHQIAHLADCTDSEVVDQFVDRIVEQKRRAMCNTECVVSDSYINNRLDNKALFYEALVSNVSCGIITYVVDNDNIVCDYYSDSAYKMLGYTRKEFDSLMQESALSLVHNDDAERVRISVKLCAVNRKTYSQEFRLRTRNGEYVWVNMICNPIIDHGGATRFYGSFWSIRKGVGAEEHHESDTEDIRTVDEPLPAGTVINTLGYNGPLLYVSTNMEKLTGYSIEEFKMMHTNGYRTLVHPDDYDRVTQLGNKHFLDRTPYYEREFRLVRKDQTVYWILEKGSYLPDFFGQPAYLSIFVDINGQKCTQSKIATENEPSITPKIKPTDIQPNQSLATTSQSIKRNQDMLISATRILFPMCICINLTRNSYYALKNDEISSETSTSDGKFDELFSTELDTIPEQYKAEYEKRFLRDNLIQAYNNGERVISLIYQQAGGDGNIHWKQRVVIFIDTDVDDDIFGITISRCVDDTSRTELHYSKQEKDMQNALALAQRANGARRDFLASISHDLRTPLNSIINIALLAVDELDNKELLCEDLKKILLASDFMLQLVNDILDMSLIENDKLELHPSAYSHDEFCDYVHGIIQPLCANKKIVFDYIPLSPSKIVYIDKVRINQVFFNILSNAVKYTSTGGRIEFREECVPSDDGCVMYTSRISDNGCGMSQSFVKHIFNPFDREDSTNKYTGTGLGLMITKNLLDKMGGTIRIESNKNVGTDVYVSLKLPLATNAQIDNALAQLLAVSNTDTVNVDNNRILVVEDSEINQIILRRMLEKKGYAVECANNGEEAIERVSQHQCYCAILMDIRMPIMDGIEATKRIRSMTSTYAKNILIIAITADAFEQDAQRCYDAGMNAFISKPIMPEKLYQLLTNHA
ncbi:MAG: PAS domain-containing protein [Clostridia bacterium]|nr:PAS domain-containing protein [Clostridia bacterium]